MTQGNRFWIASLVLVSGLAGCAGNAPTACQIDDTIYFGGAVDPDDPCQTCQPAVDPLRWSKTIGAVCGDTGTPFDAGPAPDSGPLGDCTIGEVGFVAGELNPTSSCQTCQPSVTVTAWTNLVDGSLCANGGTCYSGACKQGCLIDGGSFLPGATDNGGCLECVPAGSRTAWTELSDGTICGGPGSPSVCHSGACQSGCFISGIFHSPGDVSGASPCQSCQPFLSASGWSDLPSGAVCADGGFCQSGICRASAGCTIDGTRYAQGAANPMEPSQCCSPRSSSRAWSYRLQDGGTYDLDGWPSAVVVADFNGDGHADLAVAAESIEILLGRGDGSFAPPVSYQACSGVGIAVGDVNGDGFPDLVVADCDTSITVLLNNADRTGTFTRVDRAFSISRVGGESFPLVDLDGDGILDLALPGASAFFLKGLSDGGFEDPIAYPLTRGTSADSIAAGRFRTGGPMDLVTANGTDEDLSVFLGEGDGTFVPESTLAVSSVARSVAVGDFNGDGNQDLAVGGGAQGDGLTVFLGNGDGTFSGPITITSEGAERVALADLDGDGRAEAITADYISSDTFTVAWPLANGGVSITSFPVGQIPNCVTAQDVNGDGLTDVIIGTLQPVALNLFVNGCP